MYVSILRGDLNRYSVTQIEKKYILKRLYNFDFWYTFPWFVFHHVFCSHRLQGSLFLSYSFVNFLVRRMIDIVHFIIFSENER